LYFDLDLNVDAACLVTTSDIAGGTNDIGMSFPALTHAPGVDET